MYEICLKGKKIYITGIRSNYCASVIESSNHSYRNNQKHIILVCEFLRIINLPVYGLCWTAGLCCTAPGVGHAAVAPWWLGLLISALHLMNVLACVYCVCVACKCACACARAATGLVKWMSDCHCLGVDVHRTGLVAAQRRQVPARGPVRQKHQYNVLT